MAIDFTTIIGIGVTLLAGVIATYVDYNMVRKHQKQTQVRTSEKIDNLARVLRNASSEIEKLETEVTNKSRRLQEQNKRLQELDETASRLDSLVSLKENQVEAIRDELKATLSESNRSNRVWTIVVGAIWFILGLLLRGFLRF